MSFFSKLFRREQKMTSLELFKQIYGGRESSSGTTVSVQTALETATVFAIIRVLADGVGQVPLKVFQRNGRNRAEAPDHPLSNILGSEPNRFQTAFEFFEMMMFHIVLTGNFFAFINRVGSARRVYELVPLLPQGMTVKRHSDWSLSYEYRAEDGLTQVFPAEAILHVRGPSWNGWKGLDSLNVARNAVGLGIALEEAHAKLHKNGARTSGLLSVDAKLSKEQYAYLESWLDKYELGGDRYQKAMLLDNAASYTPTSMTGVDAEHLATRNHQIKEICGIWRVNPIMIGQSDKAATYASAEQMFLAHVVHTLSPIYRRIEQSLMRQLLSPEDKKNGYYAKFMPNALMRGSSEARANYYSKALGGGNAKGWMTQNEVRASEDMNAADEAEADLLPQPSAAKPTPKADPEEQQ